MKRRRTQADRSAATRQALVEAAVRLLIAHGYAGATVRNIARESGVSPGAVQYHFKCKEDVAIAALTHLFEEAAQRLALASPRGAAIGERPAGSSRRCGHSMAARATSPSWKSSWPRASRWR